MLQSLTMLLAISITLYRTRPHEWQLRLRRPDKHMMSALIPKAIEAYLMFAMVHIVKVFR
jgi:hypothetical protein